MRWICLTALLAILPSNSFAIVGGGKTADDGGRAVVTIVGSRGNFCSGAVVAADIVLTAAHCVPQGATYKIVIPGENPPRLIDVRRIASHPQFSANGIAAHRASADVALLQAAEPLAGKRAVAQTATPLVPLRPGNRYSISGIGVTVAGDGKTGGIVRSALLVATGKPGTLQVRLVDPVTDNKREGLGACTGDSGGPVFENQHGRAVIVGVVSWSTAPNNTAGCGGLTGTTPLSLYRGWILDTIKAWEGR